MFQFLIGKVQRKGEKILWSYYLEVQRFNSS